MRISTGRLHLPRTHGVDEPDLAACSMWPLRRRHRLSETSGVTTWLTTHETRACRRRCEPRAAVLPRRARERRLRGRGSAERARSAREAPGGALRPPDRRRQHAADGRPQFLETLRGKSLPLASIPALVTSTEAAPHRVAAARAAGANFYLVKPIEAGNAGGVRRSALRGCAMNEFLQQFLIESRELVEQAIDGLVGARESAGRRRALRRRFSRVSHAEGRRGHRRFRRNAGSAALRGGCARRMRELRRDRFRRSISATA